MIASICQSSCWGNFEHHAIIIKMKQWLFFGGNQRWQLPRHFKTTPLSFTLALVPPYSLFCRVAFFLWSHICLLSAWRTKKGFLWRNQCLNPVYSPTVSLPLCARTCVKSTAQAFGSDQIFYLSWKTVSVGSWKYLWGYYRLLSLKITVWLFLKVCEGTASRLVKVEVQVQLLYSS